MRRLTRGARMRHRSPAPDDGLQRLTAAPRRLRSWLMRLDHRRPGQSSAPLPPAACVAVARWAPKAVLAARSAASSAWNWCPIYSCRASLGSICPSASSHDCAHPTHHQARLAHLQSTRGIAHHSPRPQHLISKSHKGAYIDKSHKSGPGKRRW